MGKKRAVILLTQCMILSLAFCGCSTFVPLSERAIVKGIYLDESNGMVQSALVVYTCAPSANTAEARSEARIYTGEGATIEQALKAAEKKQNKKPFYAQNRLLLLGPHTFDSASDYLLYFGAEEVSRANLSVFLTDTTREEFSQLEEKVSVVVEESERLMQKSKGKGSKVCGVHEIRYDENEHFYGYLPILQIHANEFTGVEELMLYDSGTPLCTLRDLAMQLTLLLSGKAQSLETTQSIEKTQTTLRTQQLFLQREIDDNGMLFIQLCGKTESLTQNGRALQGDSARQTLQRYNALIDEAAQQLIHLTTQRGNDVFACGWWAEGALKEVRIQSRIRMA
ncbi:MAG: hypothetical protein RSD27_00135 [Ruthenibacterium sp.]